MSSRPSLELDVTTTHRGVGRMCFVSVLLLVATSSSAVAQQEDVEARGATSSKLQLAPPWLGWTVTDDNVMGGVSSGTVEELTLSSVQDGVEDLALLSFSGTVSFDRNGGFSSASSHGGGSYRFMQRLNNAISGVDAPVPLDLSRFGEDGGIRVTFRGDDFFAADEPPRAVNLNVYETQSRMNFGGGATGNGGRELLL